MFAVFECGPVLDVIYTNPANGFISEGSGLTGFVLSDFLLMWGCICLRQFCAIFYRLIVLGFSVCKLVIMYKVITLRF